MVDAQAARETCPPSDGGLGWRDATLVTRRGRAEVRSAIGLRPDHQRWGLEEALVTGYVGRARRTSNGAASAKTGAAKRNGSTYALG